MNGSLSFPLPRLKSITLPHFCVLLWLSLFFLTSDTPRTQKTQQDKQLVKYGFWYNSFPPPPCVCPSLRVPTRSIDTDQDTLETKATTEPHQSPVPIKSWWQRENRESEPRLMCVATERERGQRYLYACNHPNLLHFYHKHTVYCERMTCLCVYMQEYMKQMQTNTVL